VIDHQTLPLKHDVETGTAKSLPLACHLPQALAQGSIIVRLRLVMIDRSRNIDQQAGFPFTQPKTLPGMGNRQTFGPGL